MLFSNMFYTQDVLFGLLADGIKLPLTRVRHERFRVDYYLLAVAVAVVCFDRDRRDRPRSPGLAPCVCSPTRRSRSTTQGATTNVTRALVFGTWAFFAGIFGALMAGFFGSISGASFPSFTSLTIIVVVVLAAGGAPRYALVVALAFFPGAPDLHR